MRSGGMNAEALVAPFPWFGGKRSVASEVWARLGNVANYVEPFFGSGAVLLARPHAPQTETVNDVDHFLCNFWRAVKVDPGAVAHHADWPVNEADLQSRHAWLVTTGRERIARCEGDPDHFDSQVAGWWLWGACAWIGSGWCLGEGPWEWDCERWQGRQLPHLSAGRGINRRNTYILAWMEALSERLRGVRVACGDWSRVTGQSVTWGHGMTGVFLDPPYGVDNRSTVYSHDCRAVAAEARDWAIKAGRRADMRIVFAGYAGEREFPADWSEFRWKAKGGYGSQGDSDGRDNSLRETLWFSPACIKAVQPDLLDALK